MRFKCPFSRAEKTNRFPSGSQAPPVKNSRRSLTTLVSPGPVGSRTRRSGLPPPAETEASTHLPSGERATAEPFTQPHGGRSVGLAQVDGRRCATSFSALRQDERLSVQREIRGRRAVQPGEIPLLFLPGRDTADDFQDRVMVGEHAAVAGDVVELQVSRHARDQPAPSVQFDRIERGRLAVVGGREPDLPSVGPPAGCAGNRVPTFREDLLPLARDVDDRDEGRVARHGQKGDPVSAGRETRRLGIVGRFHDHLSDRVFEPVLPRPHAVDDRELLPVRRPVRPRILRLPRALPGRRRRRGELGRGSRQSLRPPGGTPSLRKRRWPGCPPPGSHRAATRGSRHAWSTWSASNSPAQLAP